MRDPLAGEFATRAKTAGRNAATLSEALFGIGAIFGDDLPREQRFTQAVAEHLDGLFQKGAKATAGALG